MILPPPLLEADLADSGELDAPLVELDATSQSEAVLLALALEPREADLLFGPHSPVEVLECPVKVPECLLWGALGDLVHPRELVLLKAVEQFVLLHGISEPVLTRLGFVELDALLKPPVVGKASNPCMLVEGGPLDVARVEFIPVCPCDQHENSPADIDRDI